MFYQTRLTEDLMEEVNSVRATLNKKLSVYCDWSVILGALAPNKRVRAKQTIESKYFQLFKQYCHNHPVVYDDNNILCFKKVSYSTALKPVDKVLSDHSLTLQAKVDYLMDMGISIDYFADILDVLTSGSEDESSVHIDIEH